MTNVMAMSVFIFGAVDSVVLTAISSTGPALRGSHFGCRHYKFKPFCPPSPSHPPSSSSGTRGDVQCILMNAPAANFMRRGVIINGGTREENTNNCSATLCCQMTSELLPKVTDSETTFCKQQYIIKKTQTHVTVYSGMGIEMHIVHMI